MTNPKAELFDCLAPISDIKRWEMLEVWWNKWVTEFSVAHTYDREILAHVGSQGEFRAHTQRQMFYQISEGIRDSGMFPIQEVSLSDSYRIEDRLRVLVIGRKGGAND